MMNTQINKNRINDFVIKVATINGSGSQTANLMIVKTLFRMGIPVGGKNLFPSNIQGLPTWFTIRANPKGFTSRQIEQDIVISLNPGSAIEDQKALRPGGLFLYSSECKLSPEKIRSDISAVEVPFRELVAGTSESVKARKLLTNMVYVGLLSEVLPLDSEVLERTIRDQFKNKEDLILSNLKAIQNGREWALKQSLPKVVQAQSVPNGNQNRLLIDGNTAAGMGMIDGGCTFASWYPITPSSSVMENAQHYAHIWRETSDKKLKAAIIQAEDELSAICMTIGAGWAGARAMTATSGPGLSLMAEAAGLAYFAEIPCVIWNVQRAGPSTGLPTRTMQADIMSAATLSHGDTRHVLLFPKDPHECFHFARISLDLAEELQTLVIVLSDLDIGMNLHSVEKWVQYPGPLRRGKVFHKEQLEGRVQFARYADIDGDGIAYRTLPGTEHPLAAYFTRGTGHNDSSAYSEDPKVFKGNLDRLNKKWETAKKMVPEPTVDWQEAEISLLAYGSTDQAIGEIRHLLSEQNIKTNYICLKAYPFHQAVTDYLEKSKTVVVIEQNRDGQMRQLLSMEFPQWASRFKSVLSYDGWPVAPVQLTENIRQIQDQRI